MGKRRALEHKINTLLEMFPVVAIVGPRQCGKSTLARQLRPEWNYYDLESPEDYQFVSNDPSTFLQLNQENIIIDEAQQYPELFKVLRGVIDSERSRKGRFIITGSSSPEIVKGLTESLAGRIAIVELSPFKVCEFKERPLPNFYELITQNGQWDLSKLEPSSTLKESLEMWHSGGYPEPLIEGQKDLFRKHWMENYIATYVERDIRALFSRLNIHSFKRFLKLLAQFSGHQLNMSEMARALEVSVSTIKEYLDIVHQTFFWRNLEPFEKNLLKKIQKSKKGFFRDQGILHHLLKIQTLDDLMTHPVAGFSFESFAIEEIIRGLNATMETQIDFTYYRTIDKSEIDLVVDTPSGIFPFEVKLSSNVKATSLRGLENFLKDMNLKFGFLINTASTPRRLSDKIYQIPINYL